MEIKANVVVIREDGVSFAGWGGLVKDPNEAKLFTDLDEMLGRIRDIIIMATSPVTQIRIVDDEWMKRGY